jgi:hypothetical protein
MTCCTYSKVWAKSGRDLRTLDSSPSHNTAASRQTKLDMRVINMGSIEDSCPTIPSVSYANLVANDTTARDLASETFVQALKTYGACRVRDHGISQNIIDNCLKKVCKFPGLPLYRFILTAWLELDILQPRPRVKDRRSKHNPLRPLRAIWQREDQRRGSSR